MDVEMPVLTGPDMAHRMLMHNLGREKVPILLVSAIVDLHLVAARVGTPYYLRKPFRFDDLVRPLERALTERSPPRPIL